jgi:hypothetical protein
MALFSQYPPGVQIKRWLTILTLLIIVIDFIAAGSLFLVNNLMSVIVSRYQPLVMYSGDIASSVYRLHTGLYQYLGEYRQDTVQLQGEVQKLRETIKQALAQEAAADLASLQEMDLALEKYGKALQMLPKIGTVTNWKELEEIKNTAVALGGQVEELAAKMKSHSYEQIAQKAERSRQIATAAMYIFIAFFVLSLVIVILLFVWWRDFQEMILQL